MAKCPHCKKNIDHLHVTVIEVYTKTYAGGNGVYDEIDQVSCDMSDWRCPECNVNIPLADQDAADKFLEGVTIKR